MARKLNRLMAEIPDSDQQHQQINCSSPEGLYMPTRLHRNPFIGFYDLPLTVKPSDGENWCRFIDGADHCCLWWGFWSDAFLGGKVTLNKSQRWPARAVRQRRTVSGLRISQINSPLSTCDFLSFFSSHKFLFCLLVLRLWTEVRLHYCCGGFRGARCDPRICRKKIDELCWERSKKKIWPAQFERFPLRLRFGINSRCHLCRLKLVSAWRHVNQISCGPTQ